MNDDFKRIVTNYFKYDYRERGKVKWNGFFLSDHTQSLHKDEEENNYSEIKLEKMSLSEMKMILMDAYLNYEKVLVQQNIENIDHQLMRNIKGSVQGFSEDGVYIDKIHVLLTNMRSVKNESRRINN
ncbi:hypothetical protein GSH19_06980 [Lactobacillus sp. S2-2]|uniref:hypothetical protein n=1 Tax=Lactobacillus sp. S2-2 TaxID=2692917 RepID=UPI001F44B18E|nr:hypothetical protein [Lactobacillus sp. S2-2]MCF6515886.1 hypothetical protein [Lactobacillus sp. S2-2]